MSFWFIVIMGCFIVGLTIGLTGVAGFLLPIMFVEMLGMDVTESLALSFSCFLVSGVIGSMNYKKAGDMDIPFAIKLGLGSFVGAILGVVMNLYLPDQLVKILLYVVVLLSGCSILFRKENAEQKDRAFQISDHPILIVLLGFVTAFICSMSGAGGPILVMPLLVVFGLPVKTAVGIALFDSIFVGIPAAAGYILNCNLVNVLPVFFVSLVTHGAGVMIGSKNAARLNSYYLKKRVGVFSILIAIWKLTIML